MTLATLACAALEAPFDLPDAFPIAGAASWNPTDRGPRVQRVELPGDPLGVAAFLRTDPEEVLLNPIQDTDFGKRALGLVPQYRRPTGTNAGGSALLDGAVDGDAAGPGGRSRSPTTWGAGAGRRASTVRGLRGRSRVRRASRRLRPPPTTSMFASRCPAPRSSRRGRRR